MIVDLTPGRAELLEGLRQAQQQVVELAAHDELVASDSLDAPAEDVLERALRSFSTYHDVPVLAARGSEIVIGDPRLLYFYRNRLDGYGLLGAPSLLPAEAQ